MENKINRLNNKPVYKLVDGQGRVQLPKSFREAGDMNPGDIVRLELHNGKVTTERVHIVEELAQYQPRGEDLDEQQGDTRNWQRPCRPQAVEAYVRAAMRELPRNVQFDLASCLLRIIGQKDAGQ